MKERLKLMSNLILTREFSNECGEVQWHVIKSHIESIKSKRDKHQGRLEALAEQKMAEQKVRDALCGATGRAADEMETLP